MFLFLEQTEISFKKFHFLEDFLVLQIVGNLGSTLVQTFYGVEKYRLMVMLRTLEEAAVIL